MNYSVKIPVIIIFLISLTLCLTTCKKKPTPPVVTTTNATDITQTTATTGGNVTSDGNADVTSRGVCWNSTENPTLSNNKTSDGAGTGSFTSNLTQLTPGTNYYVRAYATNSEGTSYGSQITFNSSPIVLAILTTTTIGSITSTTAVSGGNITSDGGGAITARGVCWGTATAPLATGLHTTETGTTGTFTSNLTGLTSNTKYYIRAYATNGAGTAYGDEKSFTTEQLKDADGNVYTTVTIGTQVWMGENLKTTKLNDGTEIPNVTDPTTWENLTTLGYGWYNNDANTYKTPYGAYYNWYSVNTGKLCPPGWHVPTDNDVTILVTYLGGADIAGGKLKETGTNHWLTPNTGATNETGFLALPGGTYNSSGYFDQMGRVGVWWYIKNSSPDETWWFNIWNGDTKFNMFSGGTFYAYKATGFSVRCLKDE
jgi:uncharacterized protein (TIGR02145 family)